MKKSATIIIIQNVIRRTRSEFKINRRKWRGARVAPRARAVDATPAKGARTNMGSTPIIFNILKSVCKIKERGSRGVIFFILHPDLLLFFRYYYCDCRRDACACVPKRDPSKQKWAIRNVMLLLVLYLFFPLFEDYWKLH